MVSTFRPFTIVESSAKMPSKCRGIYRHGALVQTDGVHCDGRVGKFYVKYVDYSGNLHAGGKIRDAFSDWRIAAAAKCRQLNDEYEIALMRDLGCAEWKINEVLEERNKKKNKSAAA